MAFSNPIPRCTACNLPHTDPKDKECPELLDVKDGYVSLADFKKMAERLVALEEKARENALKAGVKGANKATTSSTDDVSSTSAYSAGHRQRSSRRRGRQSRRHRRSDSRALKSSRYSHHRHLSKGETIKSFEKLMCVNLRIMDNLLSRGEDITFFGRHLTVLADKAETRFYRCESLVAYDKAVRTAAAKEGASKFGSVDSNLVMLHLGFDAAVSHRRPTTSSSSATKSRKDGYCFKFNGGVTCDSSKCQFCHVRGNCGDSSHTQPLCKKAKLAPVASNTQEQQLDSQVDSSLLLDIVDVNSDRFVSEQIIECFPDAPNVAVIPCTVESDRCLDYSDSLTFQSFVEPVRRLPASSVGLSMCLMSVYKVPVHVVTLLVTQDLNSSLVS